MSTPLTWKEVRQRPKPQDFTIDTIHTRLKKAGDLWAKMRKHKGANLLAAIDKLQEMSGDEGGMGWQGVGSRESGRAMRLAD